MKNNSDTDIVLFSKIKKGSQTAFNELFNSYYKSLCDFSYLMINDKYYAEEIVADVFANIWINRKKIKITKSVKAYLYKSTRNTTISYIRKNKKIFDEINEDFLPDNKKDFLPERKIEKEELKNTINSLLSVLPERSREIFIMHRYNGLKYSDISEFLDISVKTVEKHMSTALRIFRDIYKRKN